MGMYDIYQSWGNKGRDLEAWDLSGLEGRPGCVAFLFVLGGSRGRDSRVALWTLRSLEAIDSEYL